MNRDKTKDVVTDSFYHLLMKMPFERVTVNAICSEAGISRSTFYRLFNDKYEVMEYFFQRDCEKLIRENSSAEYCKRYMASYAYLIQRHSTYFGSVLSMVGQNNFSQYLFDMGVRYYSMLIKKETGNEISTALALKIRLYTAGTVYITKEWNRNGLPESPEDLARLVYESMPPEMFDIIDSKQHKAT